MINEDIQSGPIPQEISFGGYKTKNLHHSEDAIRAFMSTIDKVNSGQIHNKKAVISALKATDTYMKINDMHLEQGKAPDEAELKQWRQAHKIARDALHSVGEFMHHMDYWHNHEHEIQDMENKYTPATVGAEMADSYEPQGHLVEASWTAATSMHAATRKASAPVGQPTHNLKVGDKVKTKKDGKEGTVAFVNGDQIHVSGTNPYYPNHVTHHGADELRLVKEELTDKTIKSSDKIKVARVIADMLGVESSEQMSPETAVNQGLRQIKNKRMTPELVGVLRKMLKLASDVGVKYNKQMLPQAIQQEQKDMQEVDPESDYNIAKGVLSLKDYMKLKKMSDPHTTPGHSLGADDEQLRKMKIKYKMDEEKKSAKEHDFSDDQLDKMANEVDHEDDILHVYDDEELTTVDKDTGEEVKPGKQSKKVNEEQLMEVLSRAERLRARTRFLRTEPKRVRRLKIVLKRHSDTKTINKRARRLAILMMKRRIMKKNPSEMSVSEKERVERVIEQRRAAIGRLAMRLVPKIRKIENERLSHPNVTKSN